jgi:hypothetical protein
VSIQLETFDRARHRQELRRYPDLELILAGRQLRSLIGNGKHIVSPSGESPGCWELQTDDAVAEWRSRQESRRAGVGVCLCHAPGSQTITARARIGKRPVMKSGSRGNCEPGAPCEKKLLLASPDTNGYCWRLGGPGCIEGHSPAPPAETSA